MAFSLVEKYDMSRASRLNYDYINDSQRDSIKNTLKRTVNGGVKVNYKQKMKGVGRYYATVANKNGGYCVSLQGMDKGVRNALGSSIYHDIDIKNCHASLLEEVARKLGNPIDTPNLTYYNEHREDCIASLPDGKNLMQRIIYGGSIEQWKSDTNYEGDVPKKFKDVQNEIRLITTTLLLENPEFKKIAKEMKKTENVKDSQVLSYFLSTIESDIVKDMMKKFEELGWNVGAYIYDGFLVERREGMEPPIKLVADYITYEKGFLIELAEKPMEFPEEILSGTTPDDEYKTRKEEFERTHFKLMQPIGYYNTASDQFLTRTQLKDSYEHLPKLMNDESFILTWMQDPEIRIYKKKDFYPPPMVCPDDVYNTWTGFEIEDTDVGNGSSDMFIQHMKHLFPNEDERDWNMKWLAHIIQKPGIKTGVCNTLISGMGAGKTTIFDEVMKSILGKYYGITGSPQHDLFAKHAEFRNGKLMVVLSDFNVGITKLYAEEFKGLITDKHCSYEPKGIQSMMVNSFHNFAICTNRDEPVKVEYRDRRYFISDCSDGLIGNAEYFVALYKYLGDSQNIRAIYDHLKSINLEGVNLAKDRPMTEAFKEMQEVSAEKELLFLSTMFEEFRKLAKPMKSRVLYDKYAYWARHYGGVRADVSIRNIISFAKYMRKVNGLGWKPDQSNGATLMPNLDELGKYLTSRGVAIEGVCQFLDEVSDDY
jgi:hypothetical protein